MMTPESDDPRTIMPGEEDPPVEDGPVQEPGEEPEADNAVEQDTLRALEGEAPTG